MQKLVVGFVSLAPLAVLAGCAATTSGLGERSGGVRLPTGVTLLSSNKERCTGAVHIDDESSSSRNARSALVVRQGENATFAVEDEDELEWTCVGESSADSKRVRCPDDTSHVRITRAAAGGDLLFECYGD